MVTFISVSLVDGRRQARPSLRMRVRLRVQNRTGRPLDRRIRSAVASPALA
jgi:hypothetical protein